LNANWHKPPESELPQPPGLKDALSVQFPEGFGTMDFSRRMSIAHKDSIPDDNFYYEMIKNSSDQFKRELYDIYFGKNFHFTGTGDGKVTYGNVMGVEATDKQIDNLFRIQDEFGIEISLTMNQMNIPFSFYVSENRQVLDSFLEFLQGFYDRGLRNCTISAIHLVASGILHERFPDMKWKNTVNHQVSNAQQVIDFLDLGYSVIQLDRSLNRNFEELKKIKHALDVYKRKNPGKYVKTSILVSEGCLPYCPFKREHDDMQIHHKQFNYWYNFSYVSCTNWRYSKYSVLPRAGTNCLWVGADSFREFAGLVDIFKWSGRLGALDAKSDTTTYMGCYVTTRERIKSNAFHRTEGVAKEIAWAGSWKEVVENNLAPVSAWIDGYVFWPKGKRLDPGSLKNLNKFEEWKKDSLWLTRKGLQLEKRLRTCRTQCHGCHLCEKVFGLPEIDSLLSYVLRDESECISPVPLPREIADLPKLRRWPMFCPPVLRQGGGH
jgi:hypothetical protein